MDTLKAISSSPYQGSGATQVPREPDGLTHTVAAAITAMPVKSPEPKDQEIKQQISNAVKDINNFFQAAQRSLSFSLDETSGQMVMQIKDAQTNEVIRQIPGEDALKLAKQLDDLTGVLFKERA